jgi:hypothetical protein
MTTRVLISVEYAMRVAGSTALSIHLRGPIQVASFSGLGQPGSDCDRMLWAAKHLIHQPNLDNRRRHKKLLAYRRRARLIDGIA